MDAGVPITQPVAGVSIGLVKDGEKFILFTDIQGDEDHFGDMDFKVAGTPKGVTGIQLDLKIDGIGEEIIRGALDQAKEARMEILKAMLNTLQPAAGRAERPGPATAHDQDQPGQDRPAHRPRRQDDQGHPGIDRREDRRRRRRHRLRRPQRRGRGRGGPAPRSRHCARRSWSARSTQARWRRSRTSGRSSRSCPARTACCTSARSTTTASAGSTTCCKIGDMVEVKVIAIDDQNRVKLSRKALIAPPDGERRRRPARRAARRAKTGAIEGTVAIAAVEATATAAGAAAATGGDRRIGVNRDAEALRSGALARGNRDAEACVSECAPLRKPPRRG